MYHNSHLVPSILSNEVLQQVAPSVFAEHKAPDRSDRYTYIPTVEILNGLRSEGWLPVFASESVARKEERFGFTRHLIRFRHADSIGRPDSALSVGDTYAELVLTNSHDGSSAYKLHGGLYRKVCSNGLIVSDATVGSQKFRHSGNVIQAVIEGAVKVVKELPLALEKSREWQGVKLDEKERLAYAGAALTLRWDDPEVAGFRAESFLRARRFGDNSHDLWTTYNVVQENLLKGGIKGLKVAQDEQGHVTRSYTSNRAVKAVDQNVKLNKALWALAEALAEHKAA